ncbi:MAG: LytR family transcriptional regulator, partial [Chloroflexi bacterium]|nr:LytR family transcriptional regulator [Chloroflexota bacterium]
SVTPQTGTPLPTFVAPQNAPTPFPLLTDDETVTFLLLGSDKRPGSGYRTDTIVIAALRPTSGQVTLISVPRDLWVYIPGWGMNKINTAYQHGELTVKGSGPATLANTILYNLGIRIDHTAMVDFDGFRRIVDTLGGIDVPVYCAYTDWRLIAPNLDQYNENNWALYTVGPGLVHMDGDLALWYARSRMKSNDYDRGRRQQEALRAIYSRALSTDTIARIPQLYSDLSSTITTDLGLTDLLGLAPLALHLNNADIRSYYIRPPLLTGMINSQGIYIQIMDGPAVQAMLQKALAPSERAPGTESLLIEVWNGSAYDGWDALAAERLNYTGYATRLAPADRRDYASSLLYDLTPDQDPARAASLLAILGLPQPALVSAPRADSSISYVLILGADYKPCFKPETLSP